MKKLLGCIKRAQSQHQIISNDDVVAVGLSGGKDSVALLYALSLYRNFSPVPYHLKAITLDLGFEGFEAGILTDFCESLGIEHIIEKTQIGRLIFEDRKESHPCGLCARMRRGRINRICKERGITKLALGHHGDDAAETLLLSMLYESRIHTFDAVTYFDRIDLTMIRPLIFAYEADIAEAVQRHNLPTVKNPCPASGNTKRELIKSLITQMDQQVPDGRKHLVAAATRPSGFLR